MLRCVKCSVTCTFYSRKYSLLIFKFELQINCMSHTQKRESGKYNYRNRVISQITNVGKMYTESFQHTNQFPKNKIEHTMQAKGGLLQSPHRTKNSVIIFERKHMK